jgi:superfamily II RNA helicase
MVITCSKDFIALQDSTGENYENYENYDNYDNYFNTFKFPLSNFQKWAIYSIVKGDHCLITAHTGSGKTLPAEFAIEYFKSKNKKVIYTGPIKALCNQKLYDFKNKFPHISFGILTGDIKDNPDADVLIMTTEILRNTLLNRKINTVNSKPLELHFNLNIECDLGAVIFDEVHYIGDTERGVVWEQSIMLLPQQVQLIMLSATIDSPHIFADWVEKQKNSATSEPNNKKNLYLITTHERVVPLTHYLWTTCPSFLAIPGVKGTPQEYKFKEIMNKPIVIASNDGQFNDSNYFKTEKIIEFLFKNKVTVKRPYILNELVNYLNVNDMLPAICFVFSRKNVEIYAKEISVNLFTKEDTTPNIIEHECQKILMAKFKNYKEYILLEEYQSVIALLKKGIAIHHAGIMPVIREMVELLFEKRYIKLLFATETFAVGINMPTKTVIFTSLNKFSGTKMRDLLPHEYTQMAGRAGRRGIDTIGHVIHCANLFKLPEINNYRAMLTGPPKMLTSQFKLSFNLILNMNARDLVDEIIHFMKNSFVQNDIAKAIAYYDQTENELLEKKKSQEEIINDKNIVKTPIEIINKFNELTKNSEIVNNKQKKKLLHNMNTLKEEYSSIETDLVYYEQLQQTKVELNNNKAYRFDTVNHIENNVKNMINVLKTNNFLEEDGQLTKKGIVAMNIQEVHPLVFGDIYDTCDFNISASELVGLLSCFTSISMPDDLRLSIPGNELVNPNVKIMAKRLNNTMTKYYNLEDEYELNSGADFNLHFELIDYMIEWCNATNETTCHKLITDMKTTKELFLGEFIKCILKINNIAKELETVCTLLDNFSLLQKVKQIPELTLKYVVTNQSLYI